MEIFQWMRDHAWETWLGLAIILGVAEMFSLDLVLIMLAAGALVGMTAAFAGAPIGIQIVLASAASVAALAVVRPSVARRLHNGPDLQLGHGKLVGRQGVVTAAIGSHQPGRIRLGGEVWTAESYDDTLSIAVGETVEVLQIKGATALVNPIPTLDS